MGKTTDHLKQSNRKKWPRSATFRNRKNEKKTLFPYIRRQLVWLSVLKMTFCKSRKLHVFFFNKKNMIDELVLIASTFFNSFHQKLLVYQSKAIRASLNFPQYTSRTCIHQLTNVPKRKDYAKSLLQQSINTTINNNNVRYRNHIFL